MASAFLYTIIQTAKINGLDPFLYLKYLFSSYPEAKHKEQIRELLPNLVEAEEISEFLESSPDF